MEWFLLEPRWVGSRTSRIFDLGGFVPEEKFIGYKSQRKRREVVEACSGYERNKILSSYYEKIEEIEPAEVVVLTTTDTVSLNPPRKRTDLPPTHPANELVHNLNKRLYQMEKSSYIAVLDPPYIPAVLVPGLPKAKIHEELGEFYKPHKFIFWDNPKKQEEKYHRDLERFKIYSEEKPWEVEGFQIKDFDAKKEKLLLKGLEASSIELLSKFIAEKCEETCIYIIPHSSETKKRIKECVKKEVSERKKLKTKDIITKDRIFTPSYQEHNTCASPIINTLTSYLENSFGFKYIEMEKEGDGDKRIRVGREAELCPYGFMLCESAPKVGDRCRDEFDENCMQVKLKGILKKYPNGEKIKKHMSENGIVVPSLLTVKKSLEFDLNGKLRPFELPSFKGEYDTRCSLVASSRDAFDYHLKKVGVLEFPEEMEFLADVGKVCHELIYKSAPMEWKPAMEREGILFHEVRDGPLKGEEIRIHVTPDCVMRYRSQAIVCDWKTGTAPFRTWPKTNHSIQVAGYSNYIEQNSDLKSDYGVVVYMKDPQTKKPRITKVKTKNLKGVFLEKLEKLEGKHREWEERPERFIKEWEDFGKDLNPYLNGIISEYSKKFL